VAVAAGCWPSPEAASTVGRPLPLQALHRIYEKKKESKFNIFYPFFY